MRLKLRKTSEERFFSLSTTPLHISLSTNEEDKNKIIKESLSPYNVYCEVILHCAGIKKIIPTRPTTLLLVMIKRFSSSVQTNTNFADAGNGLAVANRP